jgi:hypothetical protein
MKGSHILLFYIFSSLLFLYNSIFSFWIYITILQFFSKLIYLYKTDNIYQYSIYLVNKNESIFTNEYPINYILPWNFIGLLLVEYNANCDREYLFILNNWIDLKNFIIEYKFISIFAIAYNLFTNNVFIFINGLMNLLYCQEYFNFNINILFYLIISNILTLIVLYKFVLLLQIFNIIIYLVEYYKQTTILKLGSTNQIADNFPVGFLYSKRPLIYSSIYIMIPIYLFFTL